MTDAPDIRIQRIYEAGEHAGDARVLVDRLWPRGVRKEALKIDRWVRELAPSDELRSWFGHRPERWDEFQRRYRVELEQPARRTALDELTELARARPLTLLYSARDEERNQAVVLRDVLRERFRKSNT
jgi:uncharacterized protein YeaO (DUF488 family)